jgi:thiosulfate reductase cytochrome b subunit
MKRHKLSTRIWHWINAISLVILFMSGLNISNAHRRLYWGDAGFDASEAWTSVMRFPGWSTIPGHYDLAAARGWHILMSWPFMIGLLLFWIIIIINGHLRRRLLISRAEWDWSAIKEDIGAHLKLKFPAHGLPYNFLQKLSYLMVLGLFLPLMVATGLAISPGFEPAAPWLVEILGGRQSARSIHFVVAWGLAAFFAIHIALVLMTGPLRQIRDMITGGRA